MPETESYSQRTPFLFDLLQTVFQCSDLDSILACALDIVINGLGMQNCAITLRDPSVDRFTLRASRNLSDDQLQAIERFRQKPGGNFCQQIVDSGQPVYVPNMAKSELFKDTFDVLDGGSYANVPLRSQYEILGTLGSVTRVGQQLTEHELEVLKVIGNLIGTAIKKAQNSQYAQYLIMTDERDRLARELHDTVAQSLGCIIQQLNVTEEFLARNQIDQAKANLREANMISKTAYTDMRESIFSLRTAPINESGFFSTLSEYLSAYEKQYGLKTELLIDSEHALYLPLETTIHLLRIIQEALSNSRKHAHATSVSVRFQQVEDTIIISVTDDGCGFSPAEGANKGPLHLGLQIMQERVECVDGKLRIESSPGHGTRILIELQSLPEKEEH
ncbi:MAG: GAF domain-containing sensor histidine kinase [Coriobacteriia bacterium]|nr:GAF domain-containing sensor histidine kinase [Coriobacteriia bacterium]